MKKFNIYINESVWEKIATTNNLQSVKLIVEKLQKDKIERIMVIETDTIEDTDNILPIRELMKTTKKN